MERIAGNDKRNFVFSVVTFRAQHVLNFSCIHTGVPTHICHEQHQRIDGVGVAFYRVADHHMHHAVVRNGRFPRIGFIDTQRLTVIVNHQIFRRHREA